MKRVLATGNNFRIVSVVQPCWGVCLCSQQQQLVIWCKQIIGWQNNKQLKVIKGMELKKAFN